MNRANARRRLNLIWWGRLALCVLPWLVLAQVDMDWGLPPMAFFIAGLLSLFLTLKFFPAFKRALWAMGQTDADESARWGALQQAQGKGLYWASLPAWMAALGTLSGLEGVACLLLIFGSVMIFALYRIPRQVLLP
ncbi:hypothetical protein [Pseudomonas sp. B392_1p]|uniref:hypothetical protein n=1 Tax=Pseudomonas sp. B392_1p TaxID=3457507 RepID=UPI003FCFBB20